jgi:two-component system sensor histidine kinase KdpD
MDLAHRAGRPLIVAASVGVLTVLIALLRSATPVPNLAAVYLPVVVLFAVRWGRWPALLAAILAVLAYNFFFVEPIHTFTIFDPQEWIELLVFLFVAAVTSNLAARARAGREEARRRADEATLLYAVSRALGDRPLRESLAEVAELLRVTLNLRGCAVFLADGAGRLEPAPAVSVGESEGASGAPAEWLLARSREARERTDSTADGSAVASAGGSAGSLSDPGTLRWIAIRRPGRRTDGLGHQVPLRVERRTVGSLRVMASPVGLDDQASRLLSTVADQLASAIERERLRQAANEAELLRRTDEVRAALLSSVSHDLRTPLASIKASAGSLLQHDVPWSDTDREAFAAAIDREADRLDRLVRNLLDMSRIEGGALHPRREWYDLAELIREVVARLTPLLADRPLHLSLPDGAPPIQIDYLMIDQVLTNLLENAAKHTPPGTPIEVEVENRDSELRVSVVDHGPGIPRAAAGRVFDKFQRLGDSRSGGSGLGLAVSRGFVEAHGGRLWLDETPSGGATFRFSLPLQELGVGSSELGQQPQHVPELSTPNPQLPTR